MKCEQFESILEQHETGLLPAPALAHIDACKQCRALSADFDAIRNAAMELDAEGITPPERIWISLRNQLEAEGIIRVPDLAAQSTKSGWWHFLQRPALAGAFLSLTLVAASLISYMSNSTQVAVHPQSAVVQETSTVPAADNVFKEEVLTVSDDSIPGIQREDAAVTDSIHRNLGIVDNFIAMCEKSVREQPDNAMAREYLYGAYEQKAELLATAMNRGTGGVQ